MNSSRDRTSIEVAPFIDGVSAASGSETFIEVCNPSNGERCLSLSIGCEADVDRAVQSAKSSFYDGRWSDLPPSVRKKAMHRFADLVTSNAAILDALDAEEMGKPVSVAFANASAAAGLLRFYAEAVDKVSGDVYTSDRSSVVALRRVPRGVVAAVVPWNFPTYAAMIKLGPALAAGNCVVLKPSEMSSRSALRLASLALEAGIPPGTFNVVPGLGEVVGRALALHRDIDMITFTGSTDVGKLMMQYAGQSNLKVVVAECGGKSPTIIFDDGVDLDAAAESIARMLLTNQGQICSVGSRLLVERSIEDVVVEKIAGKFSSIVMGDARDPGTTFGPIASAKQCSRVMRYIDSAKDEGAELVSGGRRVLQETGGYFVEPTVFRDVAPDSKVAQEEIFGPVLAVIPFKDESEAIRIANSTIYGLAAYIWTARMSTGMRMVRGIRSAVGVNACQPLGEGAGFAASAEPAGYSGVGVEGGLAGMESYLRCQRVWFNHG